MPRLGLKKVTAYIILFLITLWILQYQHQLRHLSIDKWSLHVVPEVRKDSLGLQSGLEDGATSSPPTFNMETSVPREGIATPRIHGFLSIPAPASPWMKRVENVKSNATDNNDTLSIPVPHSAPYVNIKREENTQGNDTDRHGLLPGPTSPSTLYVNTKRVENIKGKGAHNSHVLAIHLVVIPFMQYSTTDSALLAREKEYKTAIQRNLNHSLVSRVHVLTTDMQQTLERYSELTNLSKLVVSEVKSVNLMRSPFNYISQKLLGKYVMFLNADIYIGNGFDRVDPIRMNKQKIMYALTRRVAKEEKCDHTAQYLGDVDLCLKKKYWGSHDAFLFRLTKPLPEKFLRALEFRFGSPGQENVVIWLFRKQLKYCVINPCSILEIFHLHCSDVRNRRSNARVDTKKSARAPFTNKLVCL